MIYGLLTVLIIWVLVTSTVDERIPSLKVHDENTSNSYAVLFAEPEVYNPEHPKRGAWLFSKIGEQGTLTFTSPFAIDRHGMPSASEDFS